MKPFARFAATLALSLAAAFAFDFSALKPQGYVSDFSGVVDPASKAELERYLGQVEKATGAQVALVTLPSLQQEPIEDVANLLFRKWGVGQKGTNEGVLLLLVTGERRSRLEVGYGLEPILPDGLAGSLLREMRPALREQRYGEAFLAAAHALGSRIAGAKGVRLDPVEQTRPRPRPRQQNDIPWPVLLGGFAILSWLVRAGGRRVRGVLPAIIAGDLLGRSWSDGRSSGGFGGYDSGGGFGGFGGGDSGGGGASSDW